MLLLCLIKHKWNGCTCERCGAVRDKSHHWAGCVCRKCGAMRDEGHRYDKSTGKCLECGKICEHAWNGCGCAICGKERNEQHDWDGCLCAKCGKKRDEQHDWDSCVCKKCGLTRQSNAHSWVGCKCEKCGATRNEQHDWGTYWHNHWTEYGDRFRSKLRNLVKEKDLEPTQTRCRAECSRCGKIRKGNHKWKDGKCEYCGTHCDHTWQDGKCTRCGLAKPGYEQEICTHEWNGCVCTLCGLKNEQATLEDHDTDGCICKKCGAEFHTYVDEGPRDPKRASVVHIRCTKCGHRDYEYLSDFFG